MRKLSNPTLAILAILFSFSTLFAQNPRKADSLRARLDSYTQRDSSYLLTALALSASLSYADPDQALRLIFESKDIADSMHLDVYNGRILNQMANVYRVTGNNSNAARYYVEALRFYEEKGDRKWVSNIHANLAAVYLNSGDTDKALEEVQTALDIRNEIGYTTKIAGVYNTFGNIYSVKKEKELSMKYYTMALDSALADRDSIWIAMFYGNIGNIHGDFNELDKCLEMNKKALAIHKRLGMRFDVARDQHNIGLVWKMEARYDSALHYLLSSMKFSEAEFINPLKIVNTNALKGVYEALGNYKQALYWANRNQAISDSIHKENISREIQAAQMNYQLEKDLQEREFQKETRALANTASLKRQRIITTSAATGFVLILLLALVLYRRFRDKKVANIWLEQKIQEKTRELSTINHQLKREVEEKEAAQRDLNTYIYRSSHDLKGPLMSVKGLVEVANNDPSPQPYLQMVSTKVEQLDNLLEKLIENVEADRRELISRKMDWEKLQKEVISGLKRNDPPHPLQISIEVQTREELICDPYAILGILRHLLQNAVDFRDLQKENSTCIVSISSRNGDFWIEVKDNGIGIAPDLQAKVFDLYYRGSNLSKGNGMGLYLANRAAGRIGGSLSLESREGVGTTIILKIPAKG
ncbi:MAG: tetratricopeptide repeat-containing sensor histidine kinase [Bacteroidia bacterium]|nr:tetratricopeptide repeat-containing sensor histidine kinase [Bacteroidia bacterium]